MRAPFAIVAMSGGVDSSVAAALLLEAGWRVHGVTLRLWDSGRSDDPAVCSNAGDAARVCAHLGIPHEVIDRRAEFERRVVEPFVRAYAEGRTPSPCHACNGDFKLGTLLERADALGADVVATGHYARVERRDGRVRLLRGADASRDQSYFLFELGPRELARARFPLGETTKVEVRAVARRLGLPVADKPESQDLCFGRPVDLVAARGAGGRAGDVALESGRVLGRHGGLERFTVGQRRGLGVSHGAPLYVQRLERRDGRVIVGEEPPRAPALWARRWRWIAPAPGENEVVGFQLRHRQRPIPGRAQVLGDEARIRFEEPAFAVAPGQAAVAYRDDEVLGGGWIEAALGGGG